MNKNYIKSVSVLGIICLVIALALGVVNFVTSPIIEEAEIGAEKEALAEVRPGAAQFTAVNLKSYRGIPEIVTNAYTVDDLGGYVVRLSTKGYKAGLVIMVGIDANGTVTGAKCLASQETNGAERNYGDRTVGRTLDDIDTVDTVAQSTMTTTAYKDAVWKALGTAKILSGGTFDARSEEEKRLDNALPGARGKFTAVFITEYLEGLTKVYHADNNAGYVLVFGDEYIPTSKSGIIKAEGTNAEAAKGFISKLKDSTLTELDISSYSGLPKSLKSAAKTESGNYVFELVSEPHQYTKIPITIKISIRPDGKIIDCLTISQGEGEGYGDKCANSDYYKQYVGKDESEYSEITISGATQSANKYLGLVTDAYTALKIMEGGK